MKFVNTSISFCMDVYHATVDVYLFISVSILTYNHGRLPFLEIVTANIYDCYVLTVIRIVAT